MIDRNHSIMCVRAQRNTAAPGVAVQAADLPTSMRQLARALAHLAVGGSVLWAVAAAACLAYSL
jgi:hypothetical protein